MQVPKTVAAGWMLVQEEGSAGGPDSTAKRRQEYKLKARDGTEVSAFEEEAVRKACLGLIQVGPGTRSMLCN